MEVVSEGVRQGVGGEGGISKSTCCGVVAKLTRFTKTWKNLRIVSLGDPSTNTRFFLLRRRLELKNPENILGSAGKLSTNGVDECDRVKLVSKSHESLGSRVRIRRGNLIFYDH